MLNGAVCEHTHHLDQMGFVTTALAKRLEHQRSLIGGLVIKRETAPGLAIDHHLGGGKLSDQHLLLLHRNLVEYLPHQCPGSLADNTDDAIHYARHTALHIQGLHRTIEKGIQDLIDEVMADLVNQLLMNDVRPGGHRLAKGIGVLVKRLGRRKGNIHRHTANSALTADIGVQSYPKSVVARDDIIGRQYRRQCTQRQRHSTKWSG